MSDEGGDTACWLEQLCPDCRAMPTPDSPDRCWRCGAPLPPRPPADEPA